MLAKVKTVSFIGIKVLEITVEVHIGNGLPFFTIVGLPDKNISEARDRIRAVFNVLGMNLPPKRITVNMSPANIQKEGSHYDLPIAIGILVATGVISQSSIYNWLLFGELSLDGSLNNVKGALLASIYANEKDYTLVCPFACSKEIALSGNQNFLLFKNLTEVIAYPSGGGSYLIDDNFESSLFQSALDMADVIGQFSAKRALEIAAVFRFNVLMIGPPGVGKSMLAKRLLTILPPLTAKDLLEINMIYSITDHVQRNNFLEIPYRDPHYSSTLAALIGGGAKAMPGEVTLAHKGVLFLDELGEYSKVLEGLRQCMEDKMVTIARANNHIQYPADCQVIAAMNPCKCGYFNTEKECKKAPACSESYMSKISGPLLERFDLIVYLEPERYDNLSLSEASEEIRNRVIAAKDLFLSNYGINFNEFALDQVNMNIEAEQLLIDYCKKHNLSLRVKDKIIRVAFVIALLDSSLIVEKQHIGEALIYR